MPSRSRLHPKTRKAPAKVSRDAAQKQADPVLARPLTIVKGRLRGKTLPTHGSWVRPTSDYRRQMMFNRMEHAEGFESFDGVRVLDVFAGTGALGLEAVSRGAKHVTFFEKHPQTFQRLRDFVVRNQLENGARVIQTAVPTVPRADAPVDLCFLDAPYGQGLIPFAMESLKRQGWLKPQTLLITETDQKEPLPLPSWLLLTEKRQKGRTIVQFLRVEP